MKYKFEIIETLSRIVEIDAPTYDDAYHKMREMYHNEDIVLDANDYRDTEFRDLEE